MISFVWLLIVSILDDNRGYGGGGYGGGDYGGGGYNDGGNTTIINQDNGWFGDDKQTVIQTGIFYPF